jgi:acetyl esterase/lipase
MTPRLSAIARFAAFLLAGMVAAGPPAPAKAQSPAPSDAYMMQRVDPDLRAMANRSTVLTEDSVRQARKVTVKPPAGQDPPYYEKTIEGLPGEPQVKIFVVNARPGQSRPGILHTHGGGYVLGSAEQYLPLMQTIAKALDVTIVSVDYRLAPETTYKRSVKDNYAGLKWLHDHAAELGVDPGRLAVMGESAGGGHAALLAQEAQRRGQVEIAAQVLIYPMLDDRTGSSRAAPPDAGRLIWTARNNRFGWRAFLGMEPGTDKVPAEAVPARARSVAGLPPAYIAVGDIDLFAREDIAYAQRLMQAGVPVELHVFRGGYHAFNLLAPQAAISKLYDAALLDGLRRALRIGR